LARRSPLAAPKSEVIRADMKIPQGNWLTPVDTRWHRMTPQVAGVTAHLTYSELFWPEF